MLSVSSARRLRWMSSGSSTVTKNSFISFFSPRFGAVHARRTDINPAAELHPIQEQRCPERPGTCCRLPESFPEISPAAEERKKVRDRQGACGAGLLWQEEASPSEIGLHQFPLITQSVCYVGLIAKSVGG